MKIHIEKTFHRRLTYSFYGIELEVLPNRNRTCIKHTIPSICERNYNEIPDIKYLLESFDHVEFETVESMIIFENPHNRTNIILHISTFHSNMINVNLHSESGACLTPINPDMLLNNILTICHFIKSQKLFMVGFNKMKEETINNWKSKLDEKNIDYHIVGYDN